jgi:hypothetical protein
MKRFERYAAQMELLREAAFVVVRRDGPDALSRRGLAAELGASDAMARRTLAGHVSLPTLAATACLARRRRGRHLLPPIDHLLPDAAHAAAAADPACVSGSSTQTDAEIDTEIVWLRLLLRHGTVPTTDRGEDLAERYRIATGRRSTADQPAARAADPATEREAPVSYLEEHLAEQRALVTRLVDGRDDLVVAVLALVDGLVLAVCTGRLTAPVARAVLVEHLRALGVDVRA